MAAVFFLLGYIVLTTNPYGVSEHTLRSAIEALVRGMSHSLLLLSWGTFYITRQGVKSRTYLTAIVNSIVHALIVYASVYWIIHVKMTADQRAAMEQRCGHCSPGRVLDDGRLSNSGDDLRQGLPVYFTNSINTSWLDEFYVVEVGMTVKASTATPGLFVDDPGEVKFNSRLYPEVNGFRVPYFCTDCFTLRLTSTIRRLLSSL